MLELQTTAHKKKSVFRQCLVAKDKLKSENFCGLLDRTHLRCTTSNLHFPELIARWVNFIKIPIAQIYVCALNYLCALYTCCAFKMVRFENSVSLDNIRYVVYLVAVKTFSFALSSIVYNVCLCVISFTVSNFLNFVYIRRQDR